MSSTNLFIPKQLNVGFQERHDTFSGKLGYVIYFDEKGKLRKKDSWDSWRNKAIPNELYDNEPVEGFVLNKNVGVQVSYWSYYRKPYIRVLDPRGFEVEITLSNLLYILRCSICNNGTLSGSFVYGWDGAELVLVPTSSGDYQELVKLNESRFNKKSITSKDAIIGATYINKKGEKLVYLGKFDYYSWGRFCDGMFFEFVNGYSRKLSDYIASKKLGNDVMYYPTQYDQALCGKRYFFSYLETSRIEILKNFSSFIDIDNSDKINDFDARFSILEKNENYSPVDKSKDEFVPYTYEEFLDGLKYSGLSSFALVGEDKITYVYIRRYESLCAISKLRYIEADRGKLKRQYIEFDPKDYFSGDEIKSNFKTSDGLALCSEKDVAVVSLEKAFEVLRLVTVNRYLQNGSLYKRGHI